VEAVETVVEQPVHEEVQMGVDQVLPSVVVAVPLMHSTVVVAVPLVHPAVVVAVPPPCPAALKNENRVVYFSRQLFAAQDQRQRQQPD
jgi:hypothetical protein